ncbi:MAG: hypothetical protein QNM01_05990 [Actinomycetes bacterium]
MDESSIMAILSPGFMPRACNSRATVAALPSASETVIGSVVIPKVNAGR